MKNKIFKISIFSLMSIYNCCFSQSKFSFHEYDKFITESKSHSTETVDLRIENLINNIQPSVYIEFDGVKIYGSQPICLFTNTNNFSNLLNFSYDKKNIEIINIRINNTNDLRNDLDFSILSNFEKLKYIYIVSDLKCNNSDIFEFITNIGNYTVLYKIAQNL